MAHVTVQGLKFEIVHGDGRKEQLVVDTDLALIGSGAHCEIRLSTEDSHLEHVAVSLVGGGGIQAEARSNDPPPTVNGSPFTKTPLLAGSIIGIGNAQVTVSSVVIDEHADVIKKKTKKTSPAIIVLGILAIPIGIFAFTYEDDSNKNPEAPKDVPALWAAPITACPAPADQAIGLAVDRKVMANGKRERRPFHVQDGIASVPMYETSAACFRAANQPQLAAEEADAASQLRAKIGEDYRAHQVRLEHALAVGDMVTAQKEVRLLRSFTDGHSGQYVDWLSTLDRRLSLKLGTRKTT
jgi:hypothetical protein